MCHEHMEAHRVQWTGVEGEHGTGTKLMQLDSPTTTCSLLQLLRSKVIFDIALNNNFFNMSPPPK